MGRTHLHVTNERAPRGRVLVMLRAQRVGFLVPALIVSIISPVLLFAAALRLEEVAAEVEAAATLLVLGPGLLAAYLARPAEHEVASRLLTGVRTMLAVSGLSAVAAAALLVGRLPPDQLERWLLVLGCLAAFAALFVLFACVLPPSCARRIRRLDPESHVH